MRSQIKILPHQIHKRAHPHSKAGHWDTHRLIQWHIPQWQSGLYCNLIIRKAIQKWWCWNCLFDLIKSSCHRGSASLLFYSLKGCSAPWKSALMWLHSGRQIDCQLTGPPLLLLQTHSNLCQETPKLEDVTTKWTHTFGSIFSFKAFNVEQFVGHLCSCSACLADSTHPSFGAQLDGNKSKKRPSGISPPTNVISIVQTLHNR